jgi:hypothetical protein
MRWNRLGHRVLWAGAPISPPVHKGFGLQVIERGLAQELDGSVNLDFHQPA